MYRKRIKIEVREYEKVRKQTGTEILQCFIYPCFFKASSKRGPRHLDRNGETQHRLRAPQKVPLGELPVVPEQRDGPPGALVPRRPGRHPHADAGRPGRCAARARAGFSAGPGGLWGF